MRFIESVAKNLKLLFRNRESAYTIIFGPILIILIVSFAFLGSDDEYALQVASYVPQETAFATQTIETLNANGYSVSVLPSNSSCIDAVKEGSAHTCIVFSEEEAGAGTVPVTFYLDLSRVNIAYEIIDALSEEMDLRADVIRRQLAQGALQRLESGASLVEIEAEKVDAIAVSLAEASASLGRAKESLARIPASVQDNTTELVRIRGFNQGMAQSTRIVADMTLEQIDEALRIVNELERGCDNCSDGIHERVEDFRKEVRDVEDEVRRISDEVVGDLLFDANLVVQYALEDVRDAVRAAQNASSAGRVITANLESAEPAVVNSSQELSSSAERLEYTAGFLRGETADAGTITTPVKTRIESITATDDRLSFAYPYLLVLVIMFIGILLSSMLVVADKTSRAAFRNFTTPTLDGYHVAVGFVTAFILLFAEVLVILAVSAAFVATPLLLNPGSTFLLIAIAIVLFTFIGMIVGYLSTTQEAAMIASISIGSVFLFVSNLVFPLESMTRVVQFLSAVNPYIVLSDLLKRSMLYGVSMGQIAREIGLLAVVAIALLIATVLVQRHIKRKYFRQEEPILQTRHVPSPLRIGEALVHDEIEMMDALDQMTRSEFEDLMKNGNVISLWVQKELRNKRLARRLRTRSKEKMIIRLDKYLERHGKRIKG